MYALRERRVHVTQEDFEMAVAKVCWSPVTFLRLPAVRFLPNKTACF